MFITSNKIINSVTLLAQQYIGGGISLLPARITTDIYYSGLSDIIEKVVLELFEEESEALKVAEGFKIIDEDPDLIHEIAEFNGLHKKIKTDPIFRKYYIKRTIAMDSDKILVDLEYMLEQESPNN